MGERGIGKTWLLRYLADHDRRLSSLAVYLDLDQRTEFPATSDYIEAVEAEIQALYPDDHARGFNAGDIRGAFTITQPM